MLKKILPILVLACCLPNWSQAASITDVQAGKFIINSQKDGSLWYINPLDKRKYPIYNSDDIKVLGTKISKKIDMADFQKIAQSNMPVSGDKNIAKKYAGQIVADDQERCWYVNPNDYKKYYLDNGVETFASLRLLANRLNYYDFSRLHKPGASEAINQYSSWEQKTVEIIYNRKFKVDLVTIDLNNPKLKIFTDTADVKDCAGPCKAKSVSDFVLTYKGFAGINGSYFDTGAAKKNYTFAPIFKSGSKFLTNQKQLRYWTTGPVVAFDTENNFYYFGDVRDFAKAVDLKAVGGPIISQNGRSGRLQASMSNNPKLIADGLNQLIDWALDNKQKTWRSIMNALAYKAEPGGKGKLYLVSVHNATLPEMADVLKAMHMDYALNLDGGSSTALYYNEEFMVGPGRVVPNAIVFAEAD